LRAVDDFFFFLTVSSAVSDLCAPPEVDTVTPDSTSVVDDEPVGVLA
jgi:hypothetical protein